MVNLTGLQPRADISSARCELQYICNTLQYICFVILHWKCRENLWSCPWEMTIFYWRMIIFYGRMLDLYWRMLVLQHNSRSSCSAGRLVSSSLLLQNPSFVMQKISFWIGQPGRTSTRTRIKMMNFALTLCLAVISSSCSAMGWCSTMTAHGAATRAIGELSAEESPFSTDESSFLHWRIFMYTPKTQKCLHVPVKNRQIPLTNPHFSIEKSSFSSEWSSVSAEESSFIP